MPNVLIFGGAPQLSEMYTSDARWRVVKAVHSEREITRDMVGDPLDWNLIVDDCGHPGAPVFEGDSEASDEYARVPPSYLEEAARARTIRIVSPVSPHNVRCMQPRGHYDLEFNPQPFEGAEHLMDFVDEYEQDFARLRLCHASYGSQTPKTAIVLFADRYGEPLVWLWPQTELEVIDVADTARRVSAYRHLSYRTAPKLWPEIYSDQFRPRRVLQLEHELQGLIADRRRNERELEEQIDQERRYFAKFAPLTDLADEALKLLVKTAFEEVFGCDVVDLDSELAEGEAKHLDLLVTRGQWKCLVEVRSSGNRGAHKSEIERLDDHLPSAEGKYGRADSKLFVFNGLYHRPPEGRTDSVMFNDPVVEEAKLRGTTLMSTYRLLEAIECRRNDEISDEEFMEAIRGGGVVPSFLQS